MPDQPLDSLDDPRVEPYRELKRKASARTPARTFIAEGEKLVLRLLDSPCRTESILCTPAARARLPAQFADDVPVYVAPTSLISKLIGFPFHRGMLACGVQPAERTLGALCNMAASRPQAIVVLCPEIRDPENLGSIIRTALAFGAAGLVAGREGTDPFSRRVLRTSMGSVLQLPSVRTVEWPHVLDTLHAAGFESIATVLDPTAELLEAGAQHDTTRPVAPRTAILFGNEDAGLAAEIVSRCRRRVTLPMAAGVNSLNVAVAAGIVLHRFRVPDPAQTPPR